MIEEISKEIFAKWLSPVFVDTSGRLFRYWTIILLSCDTEHTLRGSFCVRPPSRLPCSKIIVPYLIMFWCLTIFCALFYFSDKLAINTLINLYCINPIGNLRTQLLLEVPFVWKTSRIKPSQFVFVVFFFCQRASFWSGRKASKPAAVKDRMWFCCSGRPSTAGG